MIQDLVKQNRSYRRFDQSQPISHELLTEFIELTRYVASSRNLQPLKYLISTTELMNQKIFETLRWAAALKEWKGPAEGERPTAYIVILNDTAISKEFKKNFGADVGIAAQTILLAAVEKGLGGCMLANIDRKSLRDQMKIPEQYEIELVLALGTPNETIVMEDHTEDGKIAYYRDKDDVHHVPKRLLEDLILSF